MISQNQHRWHRHTHTHLDSTQRWSLWIQKFSILLSTSIFYSSTTITTLCSCMFTLFCIVHVAFPKLARPERADSSNLCRWASEHSARTAEFSPKRCRFCKNWPFASSKNHTAHHSTVFHMVLTAALSFCGWFGHLVPSGATRYQTNITSCMPRPRHFPICLKPIKGMSLTTSQAVSVTLLYRLHDDALMSKTKEFLQPHWGVGILLFGASLAYQPIHKMGTKDSPKPLYKFPAEFWGNVLQPRNSKIAETSESSNFSNPIITLCFTISPSFPTVSPPFPGLLQPQPVAPRWSPPRPSPGVALEGSAATEVAMRRRCCSSATWLWQEKDHHVHGSLVMSPCFTSPNHDRY